jgi:cytochrome P450
MVFMFLSEFDALATSSAEPQTVARSRAKLLSRWLTERPADLFAELLEARPTVMAPGLCVVTRAPDVREVLSNDRIFSVRPYTPRMERSTGAFILGMDRGAQYDRELSALRLAADRADLSRVADISRRAAEELVGNAALERRINLADGYARPVAMCVIAQYFGTPGPDAGHTMRRWIASLFRDIFLNLANDPLVTGAAVAAGTELREYLRGLVTSLRAQPRSDRSAQTVIARLASLETSEGWLLDEDAVRRCIGGTIVGALETVNKSFVHAFDQLLARPGELARAREACEQGSDTGLLASILEAMRFNPQNPFLYRICEETYVLARGSEREVSIPAGTLVFAATQAAMHDARELSEPAAFRAGRPPESYLFFGHAIHTCLGQHIAPVEWRELAKPLLRLPGLRRAEGTAGRPRYDGPFPVEFWVEWDR